MIGSVHYNIMARSCALFVLKRPRSRDDSLPIYQFGVLKMKVELYDAHDLNPFIGGHLGPASRLG